MAQQKKAWAAIICMIALFAMIAFVTNLCSPMAVIVKNQFGASNFLAQIGNYGNFGAYLVMGLPSGMLIKKYGYKKTSLIGLVVGIVGVLIQWLSGWGGFAVYLIGALISGACMCILNTVVNPMLNLLGGGGNKGNQLIQIGGVFNSSAAVAVYIIMGALIGEAAKAKISDATPALMIALAIFVIAFFVILFTKIEEPEQGTESESQWELVKGACKYRHFLLGVLAIGIYGAVEVGPPTYILQYLTADTDEIVNTKTQILSDYQKNKDIDAATMAFMNPTNDQKKLAEMTTLKDSINLVKDDLDKISTENKSAARNYIDTRDKIKSGEISVASVEAQTRGRGIDTSYAGTLGAIYFLMMLIGRFLGGVVGGKVSTRTMISTVAAVALILLVVGIFLPTESLITVPGVNWNTMELVQGQIPIGIFLFLLVGLCASVMWGGIFNLATEGLGKYTAIASGLFMMMVCGFAVMIGLQAWVADVTHSYLISFFVPAVGAAYILFYALIGSKVTKRADQE